MKFVLIKKLVSLNLVLALIGIVQIFASISPAMALPIRVLDLTTSSGHTAEFANIHGDFINTRVSTLDNIDLSLFDVLYVTEHSRSSSFSGRETDVETALRQGTLGLVAENDAPWESISEILGETTRVSDQGPNRLTTAGTLHPIFTGAGIPGGGPPLFASLDREDAFGAIPSGASVLVEDQSTGDPVMFSGMLGYGRYFVTGTELTEHNDDADEHRDNLLAHNAIHFVMPTRSIPEPVMAILLGIGMVALFGYAQLRK